MSVADPGGDLLRSDAQVIEASFTDGREFGEIYTRYFSTIYTYMARRTGQESASDVAAEVFLQAFSVRHRYDLTRAMCRPWLYGIASNVLRDHLRRQKSRDRVYLRAPAVEETSIDSVDLAHSRIEAELTMPAVNAALAKLNTSDREVLLLSALAELSYKDISLTLDIPIGTVRSRLSRARKRMQELLLALEQTTSDSDHRQGGSG